MNGTANDPRGTPRILHIHGSLAAGDPQAERCVRMVEAFGGRLRHRFAAVDGDFGALAGITAGIAIERLASFPPLGGVPLPGKLQGAARAMVDHHLVLTYGREAVGAALAHTSFSEVFALPPLIHHEDGSDETAAERRKLTSKWLRRVGLGKAGGLVVPTEYMEGVALSDWQQPMGRVKMIPDGIDLEAAAKPIKPDAITRLLKRPGESWLVCFSRNDPSQELSWVVTALDELAPEWHLVLAGTFPDRTALERMIAAKGLESRVHFAPPATRAGDLVRLADLVALPGGRERLPVSAIMAMAAGKALAGWSSGESAELFASQNAEFIAQPGPPGAAGKLLQLASDARLRLEIGAANRQTARAARDDKVMIAAYRRLYASAMGRETL